MRSVSLRPLMSQEAKLRGALRAKWKQNALTIPVSQLLSVLLHIGTSNSKIRKKLQNKICLTYMLAGTQICHLVSRCMTYCTSSRLVLFAPGSYSYKQVLTHDMWHILQLENIFDLEGITMQQALWLDY